MRKPIFPAVVIIILMAAFSFFLATGCQREIDGPDAGGSGSGVDDNITVLAGVRGIVIDENNQPVLGATVTSGVNTTTTDKYGVFRFNNISLSKANGYIKVVKPGYFTGSRSFVTTAGRIHNVRLKLLPKTNTGSFSAAAGGTITISSGGKLVMPANAVTDASGNSYTGMVNVAMTWIDPTAPNLGEILVGDLRGITTDGQERGLQTFGMMGVEMTGTGGQTLKIATGKTAELSFPIPASIAGSAPATIDLWHFDEVKGRWIQEGTAAKSGSYYVTQVSHFSFWNCDAPFPLINLCMTLVNGGNSQPLNNVQVRIKRANGSYGYGWTDSIGNLCGKVPKDEALTLEVLDQCSAVAYSQSIGPFSADASLGTISVTIPPANSLIITGTVTNCANANVTNGVAIIYTGGTYSYSVPVTNGTFSISVLRCSAGPLSFSVLGIDYATLQQGPAVNGSGTTGTVNVGPVQACGTSATQFVEYLVDGNVWAFTVPPNTITSIDSVSPGTYPNLTSITAFGLLPGTPAGTTNYTSFSFGNNTSPGSYPLNYCFYSINGQNSQQILTVNPTVTITTFGPVSTGFIEGNFNIQMMFGVTPKNVVCNFKVRRN